MADFCKQCSIELFNEDSKDLADIGFDEFNYTPLEGWPVLCEGCGPTHVNEKGECIDPTCKKHGIQNSNSNPALTFQQVPQSSIIYQVFVPNVIEPIGHVWELSTSTKTVPHWQCTINLGTIHHSQCVTDGFGLTKESAAANALRNALFGLDLMVERIEAICERCDIRRIS